MKKGIKASIPGFKPQGGNIGRIRWRLERSSRALRGDSDWLAERVMPHLSKELIMPGLRSPPASQGGGAFPISALWNSLPSVGVSKQAALVTLYFFTLSNHLLSLEVLCYQ